MWMRHNSSHFQLGWPPPGLLVVVFLPCAQPMDFGTISQKLASDKYASPIELLADVRLVSRDTSFSGVQQSSLTATPCMTRFGTCMKPY